MFNNKGQSLVLFVIILPILLFILVLVIDIGKVMVLKQELNNINEIVLDYGLDKLNNNQLDNDDFDNISELNESNDIIFNGDNNIETDNLDDVNLESELINLVKLNKDDIDIINIRIDNSRIHIYLEDDVEGIFSPLVDISVFNVKSSYVGYMENNVKRIERISGE